MHLMPPARETERGGGRRIKITARVESPRRIKAFRHCLRGYNLARGFECARATGGSIGNRFEENASCHVIAENHLPA